MAGMKWIFAPVLAVLAIVVISCQPSTTGSTSAEPATAQGAIGHLEEQIEVTLATREQPGDLEAALEEYLAVEKDLLALDVGPDDPAFADQQRVLAYCLLRQGNMLRQLGRLEEAKLLSEREIAAARASGDQIALARTLMSYGSTAIASGDIDSGLVLLEEARTQFEGGDSYEHLQGLGWYWILQADLATAGLVAAEPDDVIASADKALEILTPIENWPGVARAYGARAQALEKLGKKDEAMADWESQLHYEEMALDSNPGSPGPASE
jgi:tetratricopeptide (TPR) repeat protein